MPHPIVDALPQDFAGREKFSRFTDLAAFARSFQELESKLGSTVRPPGDAATAEEWGAFFRGLGAPASAESYQVPTDVTGEPAESLKRMRNVALVSHMTPRQWQSFVAGYTDLVKARTTEHSGKVEQLKGEFKARVAQQYGDRAPKIMQTAEKMLEQLTAGSPEVKELLASTGALYSPQILQLMMLAQEKIGVDSLPQQIGGSPMQLGFSAQQIAQKIREVHHSDAMQKQTHPKHKEAVAEFMQLNEALAKLGHEDILSVERQAQPTTAEVL